MTTDPVIPRIGGYLRSLAVELRTSRPRMTVLRAHRAWGRFGGRRPVPDWPFNAITNIGLTGAEMYLSNDLLPPGASALKRWELSLMLPPPRTALEIIIDGIVP